jgi:hypothetical protein
MSQALDKISLDLRSAVLGGEHVRAAQLAAEYTRALQQIWETLPLGERAASPLPKQARELLGWAKKMTMVQRALAAGQMVIAHKARSYNAARSTQSSNPIVQVRG